MSDEASAPASAARRLTDDEWKLVAARRLRAVDAAPYLASLLLAMPVFAVEGVLASVDRSARLYLDVDAFAALTDDQAVGLLLHEVSHLVHGHADRAERRGVLTAERTIWNIAGDLTINDDLLAGGFELPEGGVTCERFGVPTGEVIESYFDHLQGEDVEHESCGSGAGGPPQEFELPDADPGGDSDDTGRGLSALDLDLHRRHIAEEVAEHATIHGVGSVPAGLRDWARGELAPPAVHWRDLLRTAVRRPLQIVAGVDDYTWKRPNRRRRSGRLILPATTTNVPSVAVVLDTSGSIRPAHLSAFVSEISAMVAQFRLRPADVVVVPCDAAPHPPVPTDRVVRGDRLPGGGGTDMAAGIAAAVVLRPPPDLVVVFTDGQTPWPDRAPAVPVVVCLTGPRQRRSPPGWATTVVIGDDLVPEARFETARGSR